jgi:hypothetical protein
VSDDERPADGKKPEDVDTGYETLSTDMWTVACATAAKKLIENYNEEEHGVFDTVKDEKSFDECVATLAGSTTQEAIKRVGEKNDIKLPSGSKCARTSRIVKWCAGL